MHKYLKIYEYVVLELSADWILEEQHVIVPEIAVAHDQAHILRLW